MSDHNCPYCHAEIEPNHDGEGYEENVTHQQSCDSCGKVFCYSSVVVYHYEVWAAPCLNTGAHNFKPTMTYPIQHTKMECEVCGERRDPTPAEMHEIISTSKPNSLCE